MNTSYHHLNQDNRSQIFILKEEGYSMQNIAKAIKVHRTTVYRELLRNSSDEEYKFKEAQALAEKRRKVASSLKNQKMTEETVKTVEGKLAIQWSPEQISGWLKKENKPFVSHETIYKYIWGDKKKGGKLFKNLRHKSKKYNKRGKATAGRGLIPHRVDIENRPKIVEEKIRIGDWELDTVHGKGNSWSILTMVDRKTKLLKAVLLTGKTAEEVSQAIIKTLSPISYAVKTLTSDNGKEFAYHEAVTAALGASFYFAKPYHSWERGLNEHTNGLLRQYFAKGMYCDISEEALKRAEELINNRPRKCLGFKTPLEYFEEQIAV